MKKSAERNGTKKQPVKGDEKRRAPIGKGKGKLAGSTVAAQGNPVTRSTTFRIPVIFSYSSCEVTS